MTFEEASQIYYINKEIKRIQLDGVQLEESRRYYKPVVISDMPKGSHKVDENQQYLEERELLDQEMNYALRRLQYERRKIEKFLETIEDGETRLIIRLRCVNNMGWFDIGEEIGVDRRTASRKFYKFFENLNLPTMPTGM